MTTTLNLHDLRILRRNCATGLRVAQQYADAQAVAAFAAELAALNAAIKASLFLSAFGR